MHKLRMAPRRGKRAPLEVIGVIARGFLQVRCPLCHRIHLYDPKPVERLVIAHCSRRLGVGRIVVYRVRPEPEPLR